MMSAEIKSAPVVDDTGELDALALGRARTHTGFSVRALIILLVACGPAASKQPVREAAAAPVPSASADVDAGATPSTDTGMAPQANDRPILWDGNCTSNPLAKGCM